MKRSAPSLSSRSSQSRREFLKTSAAVAAGSAITPYWFAQSSAAERYQDPTDRPILGAIGVGGRGTGIANAAKQFGDMVAVCDVDTRHAERGKAQLSDGKAEIYKDYQALLDRDDIDAVTIGTPDHWHTKIAIAALQAGKDVYCEKPLTLTIEEAKQLRDVLAGTDRIFQVGTQQRSEFGSMFIKAVAIAQSGRLGDIRKVTCAIGGAPSGGPFTQQDPPQELDWEMWLGQAPLTPYIPERCHGNFRWWYEYSGGKMTDWGAHHVDIAHWAMGMSDTGPVKISGTAEHPDITNGYNTATKFNVQCQFANGAEIVIVDTAAPDFDNGVLIEGDKGRIFVNRGRLTGGAVEELADNPLPEDALVKLFKGKQPSGHMRNFFDSVKTRSEPISDVPSHVRALTTCHLANICIRLSRDLAWDPDSEQITGDDDARGWQSREQRAGYEIEV